MVYQSRDEYSLSARIGGIGGNSYNKITDYYFASIGQDSTRITSLAPGNQFNIWVNYTVQKDYVLSKMNHPAIVTRWTAAICAVCATAGIALWNYDTSLGSTMGEWKKLDKFNNWNVPAIMQNSDLAFNIYLVCSWDSDNIAIPSPEQLMTMPVQ